VKNAFEMPVFLKLLHEKPSPWGQGLGGVKAFF
jgi:hypothetical protein